MRYTLTLLALVTTGLVLVVLPAAASAGEWKLHPVTSFAVAGNEPRLTSTNPANPVITCETMTGSGKYTSETTGEVGLTFHSCHIVIIGFTLVCTSPGQFSGTITTTNLTFHNVIIEPGSPGVANTGILITPGASGHFATVSCAGQNIVVSGSGIIGQFWSPRCGFQADSATLLFESTIAGHQKYKQITTTGSIYDLSMSTNGGSAATASLDAIASLTFNSQVVHTC